MMRMLRYRGPFCRTCGLAQDKDATVKSLIFGWWGILSFCLMNPLTLIMNGISAVRLMRLPKPQQQSAQTQATAYGAQAAGGYSPQQPSGYAPQQPGYPQQASASPNGQAPMGYAPMQPTAYAPPQSGYPQQPQASPYGQAPVGYAPMQPTGYTPPQDGYPQPPQASPYGQFGQVPAGYSPNPPAPPQQGSPYGQPPMGAPAPVQAADPVRQLYRPPTQDQPTN